MWLFHQRNSGTFLFSPVSPAQVSNHSTGLPFLSLLATWSHPKEYQEMAKRSQRPSSVCNSVSPGLQAASAERLSFLLLIYRFITFLDRCEYCSFNKHFHLQKILSSFWLSASKLYTSFTSLCEDNYCSDPKSVKRWDLLTCFMDKSTGGVSWKDCTFLS